MTDQTKEHQFTARMRGSITEYHVAPGGDGPFGDEWCDKPHRLLYDALGEVQALSASLLALRASVEAMVKDWRTMADGVASQETFSKEARAYRDAKALTLRWAADQLSTLIDPSR